VTASDRRRRTDKDDTRSSGDGSRRHKHESLRRGGRDEDRG
jgi:hypothetical protein